MTIHSVSVHVVVIIISVIAPLIVVIVPLVSHVATISSHRFVHWLIESVRIFLIEITCELHHDTDDDRELTMMIMIMLRKILILMIKTVMMINDLVTITKAAVFFQCLEVEQLSRDPAHHAL